MEKITFLTVCDIKYLEHFENFITSFILNEKHPNVFHNHFLYIINKLKYLIKNLNI